MAPNAKIVCDRLQGMQPTKSKEPWCSQCAVVMPDGAHGMLGLQVIL